LAYLSLKIGEGEECLLRLALGAFCLIPVERSSYQDKSGRYKEEPLLMQ